jgi:hypothetical protein
VWPWRGGNWKWQRWWKDAATWDVSDDKVECSVKGKSHIVRYALNV